MNFYFEYLQFEDAALHLFHLYVCVCVSTWAHNAIQFEFTFFNIKRNRLIQGIQRITPADATCHLPPHLQAQPRKSEPTPRPAQTLFSSTRAAAPDHTALAKRRSGEGAGGVEVPLEAGLKSL